MASIETILVDYFNASTPITEAQLEAFLDVPSDRPARFITVERTGGPEGRIAGEPMLAIQVWAKHRFEAADLAAVVAGVARAAVLLPTIARVGVTSVYNFPDPDSRQARYQMTVELVTKFD